MCHIQPSEKAEAASSPDGAEQLGKCVFATLSNYVGVIASND